MRFSIVLVCSAALVLLQMPLLLCQQSPAPGAFTDSDLDGLSDELEQSLLQQFTPTFMADQKDCLGLPAEFAADVASPEVSAKNGTIYGQVFPSKISDGGTRNVEIHFYHLWKQDCGSHGHPLDAEHVSVLVEPAPNRHSEAWKANYWYAAAHEDTVCDISQIARASTVEAKEHGATVWISAGKHGSFLNPELCHRGCGGDRCTETQKLTVTQIVNLGEPGRSMNGAWWTASAKWQLAQKMTDSDFPAAALARLESLPPTDIAWFNPGRHPAQGMIAVSDLTAGKIGTGRDNAFTAMSVATDSTGNAVGQSYRETIHAIGSAARRVKSALRLR